MLRHCPGVFRAQRPFSSFRWSNREWWQGRKSAAWSWRSRKNQGVQTFRGFHNIEGEGPDGSLESLVSVRLEVFEMNNIFKVPQEALEVESFRFDGSCKGEGQTSSRGYILPAP